MKRLLYLLFLLSVLCLSSCSGDMLYSHYEALPRSGWHADSAVHYDFNVTDTLSTYDFIINLRHTDNYPNQNFWVFADFYCDSLLLASDTLDYFLADQRGRWLGNGFGDRRDMPMLYKRQFRFPLSGDYSVMLRQGMRDTLLMGVSDIGLTIQRSE